MTWKKPKEAAEYYGVSRRTIWNWMDRGLPNVKIGGNKLIDIERGDEWLRKNYAPREKCDKAEKLIDELFRGE